MKCVQLKDVLQYKDSDQWLAEEVSGRLLMTWMSFYSFNKEFIKVKYIKTITLINKNSFFPIDSRNDI